VDEFEPLAILIFIGLIVVALYAGNKIFGKKDINA
jgi:hypothetical protein